MRSTPGKSLPGGERRRSTAPRRLELIARLLDSAGHTVAYLLTVVAVAVIMIEGGRLVELATHDELVANGDRYAQLWASWEAGTRAA